jgi:hypothetical protein
VQPFELEMDSTSSGHAYGKFTAQDHSRVVAGNVYGDVTFKAEQGASGELNNCAPY